MARLENLCVYCGSSVGSDPVYQEAAIALAEFMVERGIRLVNGGGSIGLMGVMADRILELGGECYGVIPEALKELEVAHPRMTKLYVTPDMHTRKLQMVNLSDGFLALPGGYGTLDELFETLTWLQLHLHNKPVALLNVNNYFGPLIEMADKMERDGFVRNGTRKLMYASDSIEIVLDNLENNFPATPEKWKHWNP